MGEAARRGNRDARVAQAIQRRQAEEDAQAEAKKLRQRQEMQAYATMVWWQLDMSEERHRRIIRRRLQVQETFATIMGMAYGGLMR